MNNGPGVEIVVSVTVFPLVSGSPRCVAFLRQRISGRAEPQDIQHKRLVVTLPPPFQKSAFGFPPVRDRSATVLRPWPVSAAIERVGKGAYFLFLSRIRVKIRAGSQRTGEQNGAVHGRQFALPGAPAGLHVEKMIVKAVVAGSVRLGTLRTVPEKSQCGEYSLDRRRARDEAALDRDRIHRQGETGGGNAGGPIGRGLVEHQSIVRIGLVQKVAERFRAEAVPARRRRGFAIGAHAALLQVFDSIILWFTRLTFRASPQEHRRPSPAPPPRCVPDDSRHGSSPHRSCRYVRSPKDARRTIRSW